MRAATARVPRPPRRARTGRAAALAALTALAGCFAPPVLRDPPRLWADARVAGLYPDGSERVEVRAEDGSALRGVFVPADPGAPVVLALLEACSSVAEVPQGYRELADRLGDAGFALLVADWRGVGLSDGSRSARHLGADARALFDAAVERAGGDPRRVAVRGVSLGAIALADLLADLPAEGATPGCALFTAPARTRSFPARQARERYGPLPGAIASVAFRRVPGADPADVIAQTTTPCLVLLLQGDDYLSADDRAALREAAAGRANVRVVEPELIPGGVLLGSRSVLPEELEFLARTFRDRVDTGWRVERALSALDPAVAARLAEGGEARARLERLARLQIRTPAAWLAAAALAGDGPEVAELLARARRQPGAWAGLAFDDLVSALDLSDPAGPLPALPMAAWARSIPLADREERAGVVGAFAAIQDAAKARGEPGPEDDADAGRTLHLALGPDLQRVSFPRDFRPLWRAAAAEVDPDDAERRFVRMLLKCWGVAADRLVADAGGAPRVEVLVDGAWIPFERAVERDRAALPKQREQAPREYDG